MSTHRASTATPASADASAVVFVCTGNTCRSPLAERLAAHLDPSTAFSSAGTHTIVGQPMDPGMAAQLTRLGGDPAGFAGRLLDEGIAARARLLVGLTRSHFDLITGAFPEAAGRTVVLKPYARLAAAGAVAPWEAPSLEVLRGAAGRAAITGTADDDIADPYRLGWEEAARAADEIDAALRMIVGAPGEPAGA